MPCSLCEQPVSVGFSCPDGVPGPWPGRMAGPPCSGSGHKDL